MSNLVFITGAAKRIGRELTRHYARAGWHIAVHHYRSIEEAIELQAEVKSLGGKVSLFQGDLAQKNGAEELLNRVIKECGVPRLLINNASAFLPDKPIITEENFAVHMAVNLYGPLRLTQELHARAEAPVVSVVLGDATLPVSWQALPSYAMSKVALTEWVKQAAPGLLPKLRLHALMLGPTIRGEQESEAHFSAAAAATRSQKPTSMESIAATIDGLLEKTDAPPVIDLS